MRGLEDQAKIYQAPEPFCNAPRKVCKCTQPSPAQRRPAPAGLTGELLHLWGGGSVTWDSISAQACPDSPEGEVATLPVHENLIMEA